MERNQQQLETRGLPGEHLSTSPTGVLTFDERLYVKTMNAAANGILGVEIGAFHGVSFQIWPRHVASVAPFAEIAVRAIQRVRNKAVGEQMSFAAPTAADVAHARPLAGGARERLRRRFDDVDPPDPGAARRGLGRVGALWRTRSEPAHPDPASRSGSSRSSRTSSPKLEAEHPEARQGTS